MVEQVQGRESKSLALVKSLDNIPKLRTAIYDKGTKAQDYKDNLEIIFTEFAERKVGEKKIMGNPLSKILSDLNLDEIVKIFCKLTSIVGQVHKGTSEYKGLIHRDIKPENIMVYRNLETEELDIDLTDFGSAVPIDSELIGISGTADYMAPEQMFATGKTDVRTDIYQLGVVFYEMLKGKLMRLHKQETWNKTPEEQRGNLIYKKAVNMSNTVADDSEIELGLRYVITKCTNKWSSNRYSTAADVGRDVEKAYQTILDNPYTEIEVVEEQESGESIIVAEPYDTGLPEFSHTLFSGDFGQYGNDDEIVEEWAAEVERTPITETPLTGMRIIYGNKDNIPPEYEGPEGLFTLNDGKLRINKDDYKN